MFHIHVVVSVTRVTKLYLTHYQEGLFHIIMIPWNNVLLYETSECVTVKQLQTYKITTTKNNNLTKVLLYSFSQIPLFCHALTGKKEVACFSWICFIEKFFFSLKKVQLVI